MLLCLAEYYSEKGEYGKAEIQLRAALAVCEAFREDFATEYTKNLYECTAALREDIRKRLRELPKE